jgi:hypothetical protein
MRYVYLVYSLDYDTYSFSGTCERLELATLSEDIAKAKVAELLASLGPQSRKDLKPYYAKEELVA